MLAPTSADATKRLIRRYTVAGVILGMVFPLCTWTVDIATRQAGWTLTSLWRAHKPEGNYLPLHGCARMNGERLKARLGAVLPPCLYLTIIHSGGVECSKNSGISSTGGV